MIVSSAGSGAGVQGDDGAEGAVADVGVGAAGGWRSRSGARAMTRSPTEKRRSPLAVISSAADLAGGLEEPVGEPVELAAHGVAAVDHGVVVAGLVGGPPAVEDLAVEVELVVDDVEVSGGVEVVERVGDVAGPEGVGGGPVVGVLDAVGDGELGGVGGVAFAEDAEHAAGVRRRRAGRGRR